MAHEIERMEDGTARFFAVRQPAWHQLGTVLAVPPPTSHAAMVAAGADWEVNKMPIAVLGDAAAIPGHAAVVRDEDAKVLGVVGADYAPVQNRDAFAFFDAVVAEGRARFETAGVLRGGRVVWVLARLLSGFGVAGDRDLVANYLLLSNAHDGARAVQARYTPIRVVCANTLAAAAARGAGDRFVSVRHVGDVGAKLAAASQVMDAADRWISDTSEAYRMIQKVSMTRPRLEQFLDVVAPTATPGRRQTEHRTRVRREIADLIDGRGVGLGQDGVRGTAWAAFNAVCEHVDFARPVRGARGNSAMRLDSIAMGAGAKLKDLALRTALALA